MRPASWSTNNLNFIILISICFYLIMPAVNYWLILFGNNNRSCRYTGGLHWRKSIVAVITQDRVIDDNLIRKLKTELFMLVDCPY